MNFLAKRKESPNEFHFSERRAQARLQPLDGAFAFLDLKAVVAGQILDINERGLSFRYVASEQQSSTSHFVNILVRDWNFRSRRLPCQTVWDHADAEELSFGPFSVRYCGIQFSELTKEQKADLKDFIRRYTKNQKDSRQQRMV